LKLEVVKWYMSIKINNVFGELLFKPYMDVRGLKEEIIFKNSGFDVKKITIANSYSTLGGMSFLITCINLASYQLNVK